MGRASVRQGWRVLEKRFVPDFHHPDSAVGALDAMRVYGDWLRTEPLQPPSYDFDGDAIDGALAEARRAGRETLGERQARSIADACGIPLPRSEFAPDADAAAKAAADVGYPVVLKISSDDILHKSDAGGVRLGLESEEEVRQAFNDVMDSAREYKPDADLDGVLIQEEARSGREVIIGVNRDPQFGPVIMFGLGGIYVEVLKDVVFRVAPLTARDAEQMIEGIRSAQILQAFRGQPKADLGALADCLLRVSQLAVDYPQIAECDLNPLFVYPEGEGVMALDVRFGLNAAD
jgi:acetyltransferase